MPYLLFPEGNRTALDAFVDFFCQEAGHTGDEVADHVLKFAGQLRVDKDVAREKETLCSDSLAVLHYEFLLYGNQNLLYLVLKVTSLYLFLEIFLSLFLFASCSSKDVPLFFAHGNG